MMAGSAKFDQEAAFKSGIGAGREPEAGGQETPTMKEKRRSGCRDHIFRIGI